MITEKQIKSGPLLEVDFYPSYENGRAIPTRAPKVKKTSKEMQKYNRTQAIKKLIRIINTNFNKDDFFLHPTYTPEKAPQLEEQAQKDIVNYLRRVRRRREKMLDEKQKDLKAAQELKAKNPKNGFLFYEIEKIKKEIKVLKKPFRYVYVIEQQIYKTGRYAGLVNWHFHLFLTGGLADKEIERMWGNGIKVNADNYQPEKFGPEAAARYISKDPQGSKRFVCSRNMAKPKVIKKTGKVTKLAVERMATLRIDDAEYWERKYPGYKFIRCFNRWNEYNSNWYVSAVMYRSGDALPQKWEVEEWLTA